ncbi:hypothetical protein EXT70_11230 [Dickeya dadantii]|uniref:DUF6998 domain-containing protein n=1 Tax=Dickeya dadantii TaxID=204038 RepID=UPI001CC75DA1|nr:hypothetical protein [Dickeya dadantii]MCL6406240.1 hypothetical protein [Dickeya dadantii]UAY96968.1 hypothetical protein KTF62_03380 [Dickeya dadantii]
MSNVELLTLHSEILTQLRSRGVIRTKNNPVGDYAEWLVSTALGMNLLNNSSPGIDAVDSDGKKVQIKARRVTSDNPSRQLSALRNYEAGHFDYLVAVIFDEDYKVLDAYKIPHEVIRDYARYREHVNAHIVTLKGSILSDTRVTSIKEQLISGGLSSKNEPSSEAVIFSNEVMPGAMDKQEQRMSRDKLGKYIKSIGMKCFVTYYQRFADAAVPTSEIIEQLHTQEDYTEKSAKTRLSKARKIIGEGVGIEALRIIASSGRVSNSVRDDAHKLISILE